MTEKEMQIPPSPYKVLNYIKGNPNTSYSDISYKLKMSLKTVSSSLIWLENCYIIKREFKGTKGTLHIVTEEDSWMVNWLNLLTVLLRLRKVI